PYQLRRPAARLPRNRGTRHLPRRGHHLRPATRRRRHPGRTARPPRRPPWLRPLRPQLNARPAGIRRPCPGPGIAIAAVHWTRANGIPGWLAARVPAPPTCCAGGDITEPARPPWLAHPVVPNHAGEKAPFAGMRFHRESPPCTRWRWHTRRGGTNQRMITRCDEHPTLGQRSEPADLYRVNHPAKPVLSGAESALGAPDHRAAGYAPGSEPVGQ